MRSSVVLRGACASLRLALLPLCLGLAACARPGEESARTLRMGHASLPGKPLYGAAEFFQRAVEEDTGGRLKIDVYSKGALGDARLLMESVVLGTLDLTADAPLSTYIPEMGLLDLPYLFYDSRHATENLEGAFGAALAKRAEARGVVVLGYWANGSRYIFNRVRDVSVPEDLAGLKIRVPEGRAWVEMMNAFGALATPLAWGEVYTAIEQGVIDGAESDPISVYRAGFADCCKHLSRTEHIYNVCPLIIHRTKFLSLPPDLQAALRGAGRKAAEENRRLLAQNFQEACRAMEALGVRIIDADRPRFRDKVQAMREEYARRLHAEDLIALITPPSTQGNPM